jgi:hypothetical protein
VVAVVREVETRTAVRVGPVVGDDGAVLVDDPVRTGTATGRSDTIPVAVAVP